MSHSPQITDTQFSESAATWKEWLPVVSDSGVREQDIFDELLSIMWCEIKEGLENITEWFDRHINREQDMIMEEFDSDLPTAGVFQDGDPLYPGIYDPLFPDLAENDQDNAYVPSGSSAIDAAMPEELRPNCDVNSFSPSMDLAHESSSWESLSESLVITAASAFLQELESSGILFLDLFGTLESLFASRVYDNEDLPQSAGCPNLELSDIRERKKVVASMQSSLNCQTYPHASIIITKVSNLFLKGCLAALEDLEECTIFCLKLLCKPSHSVLNFFSAIVAHFSDYYHTQLPAGAKCSHDRYKNPGYVSSRFKEAAGFVRSAHRSGSTPTFSPKSDATSPNLSNPPAPLNSRKRGSMQAGVDERITISGKRSKLEGATIQREKSPKVYKFKVETGNPAARKKSKPSPNLPNV
ncbi:uncharacterized protein DFL_005325 [Arthrobotrys flagrans]|uniref:Uncharacterized protein n=1 Tax=Arthrobotrys flagrans TaxID=97331 RepID=A0A437A7I4_ARTFL|nr:hypothetical protein DFL_005325 [Arthrobotrys flagrans]